MRRWILATLAGLLGLALWLTVARVPGAGGLFGWHAGSGLLSVRESGWVLLPRWSHRRLPARELVTEVAAPAREGGGTTVYLRWHPVQGDYRLEPAADPTQGFRQRVAAAVRQTVAGVGFGCLAPSAIPLDDCPPDLPADLARSVAAAVGTTAGRLKVTVEPDPAGVRDYLLAEITGRLPSQEHKLLVLALDGLDWDLVLPWIRAAKLPNLGRLMQSGSWGQMRTLVPTLSPLIWTTVATGVTPDRHGVLDFVEKDPVRGILVPVTSRSRQVPAIWNLASALGRTVAVVGWWGSWPADRINGVMVSDRLYYTLTQGLSQAVLREDPPDMVYPPERAAEFIELRDRAVRETDWRALRYFMNVPEDRFLAAVAASRGMEDPIDGFRRVLASTRTYLGAGLRLADEQPDLAIFYLEGTDTIGHLLAPYMPPPTVRVDPEEAAIYVAAVPKYFEIVDRWIGRYLEKYPLDTYNVLVVSDHGFRWQEGRPKGLSGTAGPTAPLWHKPDAVFLLAGPGVKRLGRVSHEASVYDVAPTMAALLGIPADASWDGSLLPGCPASSLEPIDYGPLVPTDSYRRGSDTVAPPDPEFIAKLEALGYLGGGSPSQAGQQTATRASTQVARDTRTDSELASQVGTLADSASATRGRLNNLAVVKIGQKEYAEAERLLRQAIAQSPSYPSPHYNLRRIYVETQRYDEADRELWIAVDKGLRDPKRTLDRAAADYEDLGMIDRAAALLSEALRRFPEHEPFWVHQMVVRIRLEQCTEGQELGAEAADKFPDSAPVHAFYGLAAGCADDLATARAELERSLELNPDQATLRRTLASLPAGRP